MTVLEVLKQLDHMRTINTLQDYEYLKINGNELNDPKQAFTILSNKLIGVKNLVPKKALKGLEKYFSNSSVDQKLWWCIHSLQ